MGTKKRIPPIDTKPDRESVLSLDTIIHKASQFND